MFEMSKESTLYRNIGVQTKDANIGIVGSSGNIGDPLLGILDEYSQASMIKAFDIVPPKRKVSERVRVYSGKDGDVTNLEAVREFIKDLDFVACVVGARASKVFEVEAGGVSNLVKASKETGRVKQITYISVLGVGKKILDFQITQKGKREAEQHLMNSGIAYTIFRPSGYHFDLHRALIRQVTQGYINIVDGCDARVQPIAARNVAEIIAAALGNPKAYNQIFNLGGREVFSRSELAELYGRILGRKVEVRNLTEEQFRDMYKDVPFSIDVLLHMMKTDSVLEPGDMEKLENAFPGIEELFIGYETRVRELLKKQANK
jgi:uncharacterized protein YbjT (DUF2867 family)